MSQKSVFPDETGLRWKAVRRPLGAGLMAATAVAGLLMLIIEMDGSTPDPPTTTHSAASASAAPAPAQGHNGMTDPINPPQTAQTNSTAPGEWLINDVAKTRGKPEVTQTSPDTLAATAPADAHAEVRASAPLPSDTRPGGDEHGSGSPAGAVARTDTSRAPDDATTSCMEAPTGQAPEGKRWYYRLEREDHRKCWYVRSRRHEASSRSNRHQRSRRTWVNWGPWDYEW
jgi:hypothetical protein